MIRRYAELAPAELMSALSGEPVAIQAWGALEWHGPHLPLGLDGLVAEAFAEALAERTGGVLLPPLYLPAATLPHFGSISFRTDLVRAAAEELCRGLFEQGVRVVALVSGHYSQPHELALIETAETFARAGRWVLTSPPLGLLENPALLDHAARYETSQLMAIRPELVHLNRLTSTPTRESALLGRDPRGSASAEEGSRLTLQALARWTAVIRELLGAGSGAALADSYRSRREQYRGWVEQYYRGDWEQALSTWWEGAIR